MKIRKWVAGLGVMSALGACMAEPKAPEVQASFVSMCATCHGASGKGDGPQAAQFASPPADLTQIAARNGGVFPRADVIAKIHGYSTGLHDFSAMPGFQQLLDGPKVLADQGDGTLVATPAPLIAMVDYLASIQE